MLVEEVPKTLNKNGSTVYFCSSVNLSARPRPQTQQYDLEEAAGRNSKGRPKVNYNINQLMLAQTTSADAESAGPARSSQQLQIERAVQKRLAELHKDSNASFELPKGFSYFTLQGAGADKANRQGNTPTTKKIISSRRNINLYFEEERNVISVNTILNLNYGFIDASPDGPNIKQMTVKRQTRSKLKLCCMCGKTSNYSRCPHCGLYACSVKCDRLHTELRCN